MKRIVFGLAAGLLLAGCARESGTASGGSPNSDTGSGRQNTVANAEADPAVSSGAVASGGEIGTATARGAALNETGAAGTNNSAKPRHPPER